MNKKLILIASVIFVLTGCQQSTDKDTAKISKIPTDNKSQTAQPASQNAGATPGIEGEAQFPPAPIQGTNIQTKEGKAVIQPATPQAAPQQQQPQSQPESQTQQQQQQQSQSQPQQSQSQAQPQSESQQK